MTETAQRWRILFRRGPDARHLTQRDELEAWETAVVRSGLPVLTSGGEGTRPRIATAVPLPVGMTAAAEAIEILLVTRLTSAEVRSAIGAVLPPDHHLVDVHDVWLGAPSLAASVTAAEYRVVIRADGGPAGPDEVRRAAAELLAAETLPRERPKGERTVAYDLRPFLLELGVEAEPVGEAGLTGDAAPAGQAGLTRDAGLTGEAEPADEADPGDEAGRDVESERVVLRMRLMVDPQAGTGRPDEVVAALGEALRRPLRIAEAERVRFLFLDDRDPG